MAHSVQQLTADFDDAESALLETADSPRLFFSLLNTTVTGVTVSPAYAILIALAIAFALASLCAIAYFSLFKKPVYDDYHQHSGYGYGYDHRRTSNSAEDLSLLSILNQISALEESLGESVSLRKEELSLCASMAARMGADAAERRVLVRECRRLAVGTEVRSEVGSEAGSEAGTEAARNREQL